MILNNHSIDKNSLCGGIADEPGSLSRSDSLSCFSLNQELPDLQYSHIQGISLGSLCFDVQPEVTMGAVAPLENIPVQEQAPALIESTFEVQELEQSDLESIQSENFVCQYIELPENNIYDEDKAFYIALENPFVTEPIQLEDEQAFSTSIMLSPPKKTTELTEQIHLTEAKDDEPLVMPKNQTNRKRDVKYKEKEEYKNTRNSPQVENSAPAMDKYIKKPMVQTRGRKPQDSAKYQQRSNLKLKLWSSQHKLIREAEKLYKKRNLPAYKEKIDAVKRLDIQITQDISDETHVPALDSYHFFRDGPNSRMQKLTKVCKRSGTKSVVEEQLSKKECLRRARKKHYGKMTALRSRMKSHKEKSSELSS